MTTKSHKTIAAGIAALMISGTLPMAALAQSSRQKDKNNMRNLGIGLGAAAAWELLHGKGTTGLLLGAGAAYAGKKYEDARKAQTRENGDYRYRRSYRYNHSHLSYGAGSDNNRMTSAAGGRYGQPVSVMVNNEKVDFSGKQGAEMIDGATYIPLRGVLDKMGANVDWDQSKKTVTIVKGDKTVKLPANDYATVNGKQTKLDTPAFVLDGQTMLPLRFLAQTFGDSVNWDSSNSTVHINSTGAA